MLNQKKILNRVSSVIINELSKISVG